jgi:hypothetical protein
LACVTTVAAGAAVDFLTGAGLAGGCDRVTTGAGGPSRGPAVQAVDPSTETEMQARIRNMLNMFYKSLRK